MTDIKTYKSISITKSDLLRIIIAYNYKIYKLFYLSLSVLI